MGFMKMEKSLSFADFAPQNSLKHIPVEGAIYNQNLANRSFENIYYLSRSSFDRINCPKSSNRKSNLLFKFLGLGKLNTHVINNFP